jgi:hypothetical protein
MSYFGSFKNTKENVMVLKAVSAGKSRIGYDEWHPFKSILLSTIPIKVHPQSHFIRISDSHQLGP